MLTKLLQQRGKVCSAQVPRSVLAMQVRPFQDHIPTDNTPNIPPEMFEEEQREFMARTTQKQRDILAVERLAALRLQEDYINDENSWWNKLRTITDREFKMMPMGFIRKYGSYMTNMQRYDRDWHLEENKGIYDYFTQIKNLKKLQTDEEKALMLREFERAFEPHVVTMAGLERNRGDYMYRQPRVDPKELSYNFEQYGRYSKMLARASRIDDKKSTTFYKMVKYVKKNVDNKGDAIVRDFTVIKGYDPDLIEIPEEFADLPIADVSPKDFAKRQSNKKLVRTRTSKDMTNYDAWRCHDRSVFMADFRHPNVAKLWLAPADLIKVLGIPDRPTHGVFSTGEYNFEDNNLDCYKLYDFKQTDVYRGLNREDEYYQKPHNLRKPIHKRKRAWPTVEEFWKLTEPVEWKLTADEYSDVRRFKRWFRAMMKKGLETEESAQERILAKYGDKVDICQGDFNETGVINTDMACHKLDASQFMTKEELKEYPHGPVTLTVAPKMFDLSKAERVTTSKEDLTRKEQQKEAMKQTAT